MTELIVDLRSDTVTRPCAAMKHKTFLFAAITAIPLLLAEICMAELTQTLTPVPDKPPAPEFSLKDTEGETHRLSDYRGKAVRTK